ncbi:MAG TPA: sigma-70 family RNA polymerase sigma factor [Candidatus Mediterraneibacter stercoripullorum]|nr:sigma-70 family RNA polymerase sigma factor [Candidatus Mediterraneibacter stercoripullorum]
MIDQYIRQYGKRLFGLCMTLCTDPYEAEDLYQETWLKVVRNISRYDPAREFEPWLTKICVNTYRNTLRRIARSPVLSFRDTREKDTMMQSVPAPEKKDYEPLYEAVRNLPEKMRLTVVLFYFEDMDIRSAAEVLGVPPGTVKSRLSKARKLLKEVLGDETDL